MGLCRGGLSGFCGYVVYFLCVEFFCLLGWGGVFWR